MALLYCGIDEAGYGPTLGPLCVGCAIFRLDTWQEGDAPPHLWRMLNSAVCQKHTDKRRRIAVNDSKALKLPNSSVRQHPLTHLERGVLSFLACAPEAEPIADDEALFGRLACSQSDMPWYAGDSAALPLGQTAAQLAIDINRLRRALATAELTMPNLACATLDERAFNALVFKAGTKAAATGAAIIKHLRTFAQTISHHNLSASDPMPRVVCDRQSGRSRYAGLLRNAFSDADVHPESESSSTSVYTVRCVAVPHGMRVSFLTDAEQQHLPVALASMAAKLVRELKMARFNRYWAGRVPEIKPTAGYYNDASRWLADMDGHLSPQERAAMVRLV